MRALGAAVLVTWAVHLGYHVFGRHDTYDFLWTCVVACMTVGVGCVIPWRRAVAIGTSWLTYGLPIWIIGLCGGNDLVITSVFLHVGGLGAGIYALKRLGFPRGSWWRSTAALCILLALTRLLSPPHENVNLAFAVYRGWEGLFPTWPRYFAFLLATGTFTFAAVELLAVKLGVARPGRAPTLTLSASPSRP